MGRRAIYFILMGIIILMVFHSQEEMPKQAEQVIALKPGEILPDFENISVDNGGDQPYPEVYVFFRYDFEGIPGEEFYVAQETDNMLVTVKYVIAWKQEPQGELTYYQQDSWPDYKPPWDRFEAYQFVNGSWTVVEGLEK